MADDFTKRPNRLSTRVYDRIEKEFMDRGGLNAVRNVSIVRGEEECGPDIISRTGEWEEEAGGRIRKIVNNTPKNGNLIQYCTLSSWWGRYTCSKKAAKMIWCSWKENWSLHLCNLFWQACMQWAKLRKPINGRHVEIKYGMTRYFCCY